MANQRVLIALIALVSLALVGGVVIAATGVLEPNETLLNANEACDSPGELDDEDQTLVIDTAGESYASDDEATFEDVQCVLEELDVPRRVQERMDQTRSLDGRQDGEWDDIEAEWSYHPDDGLDVVLSVN